MNTPNPRVVAVDPNVLINLMHVGRLGLLAGIPHHDFAVPDHVREEVTVPEQRAVLDAAVDGGWLAMVACCNVHVIGLFAELVGRLGRGESACIAIAATEGWFVASDERGRFLREADARVGVGRVITTVDLFVLAIKAGLLSIEEADADLLTLGSRRFRVSFRSFREILE